MLHSSRRRQNSLTIMSSATKKWTPTEAMEALKLTSSQAGWNLAGSRSLQLKKTRNGGVYERKIATRVPDSDSSYSYESISSDESDTLSFASDVVPESNKPDTSRVILEVAGLQEAFENNTICPQCHSRMRLTLDTVCLATTISLVCNNHACTFIYRGQSPAKASISLDVRNFNNDARGRNTDFAIEDCCY